MTDHPRQPPRPVVRFRQDRADRVCESAGWAGVELVSTGSHRKAIAAAGLKVRDVSELTGFPEMRMVA